MLANGIRHNNALSSSPRLIYCRVWLPITSVCILLFYEGMYGDYSRRFTVRYPFNCLYILSAVNYPTLRENLRHILNLMYFYAHRLREIALLLENLVHIDY